MKSRKTKQLNTTKDNSRTRTGIRSPRKSTKLAKSCKPMGRSKPKILSKSKRSKRHQTIHQRITDGTKRPRSPSSSSEADPKKQRTTLQTLQTSNQRFQTILTEIIDNGDENESIKIDFLRFVLNKLYGLRPDSDREDKVERYSLNRWLSIYQLMNRVKTYLEAFLLDDPEFDKLKISQYLDSIPENYVLTKIRQLVLSDLPQEYNLNIIRDEFALRKLISEMDIVRTHLNTIPEHIKPWVCSLVWNDLPLHYTLEGLSNVQQFYYGAPGYPDRQLPPLPDFVPLQYLKTLSISNYSPSYDLTFISSLTYLEDLKLNDFLISPGNLFRPLIRLMDLTFTCNEPLGDSLASLTQLRSLSIHQYSRPLGNSLQTLTKLRNLSLPQFVEPLEDSLNGLTSLYNIRVSHLFNHPLGRSLRGLTSLMYLELFSFNHPLGDSLSDLNNLATLKINGFNHNLGNSLAGLSKLQTLHLRSFNKSLENSLRDQVNLLTLELFSLRLPLNNALSSLRNLRNLDLNSYNVPLRNSLKPLTNLRRLNLDSLNHPLGNSLSTLGNLEVLVLRSYNQLPIDDSFEGLSSVRYIRLSRRFSHNIPDSVIAQLPRLRVFKYGVGNEDEVDEETETDDDDLEFSSTEEEEVSEEDDDDDE